MKKVFKLFIMSTIVCLTLTFTLMIINAIIGIFISFSFYLLLSIILTLGFTLGLILIDSKSIFMKKKVKKSVKNNKARKVKKVDSRTNIRKKIS